MTIQLNNLSKKRGDALIIDGLSLSVDRGKTLALTGPSGCGKTTLLRLVAGLERPDWGEVLLGETLASSHKYVLHPRHRSISMIFQHLALWPHMSARKHVDFALDPAKYRGRGEVRTRKSEELLSLVGLQGFERRPHQLSGGEQQRLALARALAAESRYLLFDEPLSNLDYTSRNQLLQKIKHVLDDKQITALYVTHQPEEAVFIADKVAVMENGTISSLSTVQDFARQQQKSWEQNLRIAEPKCKSGEQKKLNTVQLKICNAG